MKKCSLVFAILLLFTPIVFAQDGNIDASFGADGVVKVDSVHAFGATIPIIQRDWKILLGIVYKLYKTNANATSDGFIVKRFLPNGVVAPLFNAYCNIQFDSAHTDDAGFGNARNANGRILLSNFHLVCALDSTGFIDSSFA